jgi:toprim domain protein
MSVAIVDIGKVIVVEGRSDKKKLRELIKEPVEIVCTNGTIGMDRLEELIDDLNMYDKEVFILADADDAGEKLRKQFKQELPHADHLYIDRMYREVATTPSQYLASLLLSANIDVHSKFLF